MVELLYELKVSYAPKGGGEYDFRPRLLAVSVRKVGARVLSLEEKKYSNPLIFKKHAH